MSDKKAETNNKEEDVKTSRRDFLKNVGIAGPSTLMASNASAAVSAGSSNPDAEITAAEWLQGHFVLMSDDDKTSEDEAIGLTREFFEQYSVLSDALRCMRAHLPRGEIR